MSSSKRRFAWLRPPAFDDTGSMSLVDHLRELRYRVIISFIAIGVFFIVAFVFYEQIVAVVLHPYEIAASEVAKKDPNANIYVVNSGVAAPMVLALKASAMAAVVAACPVWIYQLWAFIVPGLLKHEKKIARRFLLAAIPLFLAGVAVGYVVLPRAFEFMLSFTVSSQGVTNLQDLNDFLSLEMRMLMVFGLSFLLPVILVGLNMLGIVKGYALTKARSGATIGFFVFAAIATPSGDPFSMLALALPMVVMFAASEMICRRNDWVRLKKQVQDGLITQEEAEQMRVGAHREQSE